MGRHRKGKETSSAGTPTSSHALEQARAAVQTEISGQWQLYVLNSGNLLRPWALTGPRRAKVAALENAGKTEW